MSDARNTAGRGKLQSYEKNSSVVLMKHVWQTDGRTEPWRQLNGARRQCYAFNKLTDQGDGCQRSKYVNLLEVSLMQLRLGY